MLSCKSPQSHRLSIILKLRISLTDPQKSRTAFQRTIWALPKLVHVENTISTSWLPSVRAMARQCNSEFDEILEHLLVPDNQVPNHSLVHMYDHLSEQITSTVKSMKLLQYPVFAKPYYQAIGGWEHPTTEFQWSGALLNLEHLDLECRLDASPLEEIQGEAWDGLENDAWRLRAGLRKMTNLRSLRLSCSGSWDDINMMTTTWWDGTNGTHVDDLLHGFTFPYLNSLSLINWPVRESRLAEIIRRYRSNLKTLELQRLTIEIIDPESFGGRNTPWHRIAAVCAECINVHRFSFKDLRYHSSNLRADQPLTGPPVSPRVQEQADIEEYYRIARREMADEDMPDRLISEEEERVEADAIDEED